MTTHNLAARIAATVQVSSPQVLHDMAAAMMVVAEANPDELGRCWASLSREMEALAFDVAGGVTK